MQNSEQAAMCKTNMHHPWRLSSMSQNKNKGQKACRDQGIELTAEIKADEF